MGKPITASEVRKSVNGNAKVFKKRIKALARRGKWRLTLRTIWWKFGWMLEDLFRHVAGMGEADAAKRTLWVLGKIITPQMVPHAWSIVNEPNPLLSLMEARGELSRIPTPCTPRTARA